jgi:tetratricopeptide (TPR) repeat protein
VRAAVVIATLVVAATVAWADPSQNLAKGRQYFQLKDYGSAQPLLNDLVHPKPQLANPQELVECYLMLGASRVMNGDAEGAKAEFAQALQLEPNRQLIVNGYYEERAVRVFDETKDDLRRAADADAKAKKEAADKLAIEQFLKNVVVVENHPYYVNFIPLGVPQFQGKRPLMGSILGIGQAVTLATSVSTWLYLSTKYGFPNGKVPTPEVDSARRYQQLEIGTGIAFLLLYGYGVYDAISNYQAQTRVQTPDLNSLPKGVRPDLRSTTPPPKKTSFHVVPLLVPDGAGIGLSWEH